MQKPFHSATLFPMFHPVDTQVPGEVEAQVQSLYLKLFPQAERAAVPRSFEWFMQCFSGHFDNYQPIDALYHDVEHTLQGTLCLARLLYNRHLAGAVPELTDRMFQLAMLAILFHDTGYLKKRGDTDGTGAKYTPTHVLRSAAFAREFLLQKAFPETEIRIIQNLISCTGVNADLQSIPFQSELERTLGFALATADLLGQMAASDYVEKLPILYQEFAEAARYDGESKHSRYVFNSAEELMRNTPAFWENYVLPKINGDFGQLYRFLNEPYPDGPNQYLQKVEGNMLRIKKQLSETLKPGEISRG